jgi:hypothetical protein
MRFESLLPKLTVISIPIQGNEEAIRNWKASKDLFVPETCARHLYVGLQEDLALIPDAIKQLAQKEYGENSVLQGKEAYEFLLQVCCGLDSRNLGEDQITSQVKKRWSDFRENSPEKAKELQSLMDRVFEDVALIRSNSLQDLRPISQYLSAKRIAAMEPEQSVVLFAGKEGETNAAARAIARDNTKAVDLVYVTHPDENVTFRTAQTLLNEKAKRLIKSNISLMTFDEALGKYRDEASHWVICSVMGENPEADKAIIDAWKQRVRKDGYLVHLNGDPSRKADIPAMWKNSGIEGIILPPEIHSAFRQDQAKYNEILQNAYNACSNCTYSRSLNLRPNRQNLTMPPNDYKESIAKSNVSFNSPS